MVGGPAVGAGVGAARKLMMSTPPYVPSFWSVRPTTCVTLPSAVYSRFPNTADETLTGVKERLANMSTPVTKSPHQFMTVTAAREREGEKEKRE